jgi:hypothetical protein
MDPKFTLPPAEVLITLGDPKPEDAKLTARQLVVLKFGLDLVRAIEGLGQGVDFIFVPEVIRLRQAAIDAAIQKAKPIFTGITDDLIRLRLIEETLANLGELLAGQSELDLNDPAVEESLRGVVSLAIATAKRRKP